MTEADLIAVRFPNSQERIGNRLMMDDPRLTGLAPGHQVLFLLVEVKTDLCNINGPWSDADKGNMQRVIRRLGFSEPARVDDIAAAMYSQLRWVDSQTVLQYVAVGNRKNDGRQRKYPLLLQVTWNEIADFLFERFHQFPEKLPTVGWPVHEQWPDFGRAFGERCRRFETSTESRQFVTSYIDDGPATQA